MSSSICLAPKSSCQRFPTSLLKPRGSEEPGSLLCCTTDIAVAILMWSCAHNSLEKEAGCLFHHKFWRRLAAFFLTNLNTPSLSVVSHPLTRMNTWNVFLVADTQTWIGQSIFLNTPIARPLKGSLVCCFTPGTGSSRRFVKWWEQSINGPYPVENRHSNCLLFSSLFFLFLFFFFLQCIFSWASTANGSSLESRNSWSFGRVQVLVCCQLC